jgi:hypothetical protein
MENFKVRMLDEAGYISEKIGALEKFIEEDEKFTALSFKRRLAMRIQLFYMRRYYFWLATRIGWLCTTEDLVEYSTPVVKQEDAEPIVEVVDKKPKVKRRAKKDKNNE